MTEPYSGRGTIRPSLYTERERMPAGPAKCPHCDFMAHNARALGAHQRAHRKKIERKSLQ